MSDVFKVRCAACGDVLVEPSRVTVWHWSMEATYVHCMLLQTARLNADTRLALTIHGANVVNGEDLERQVTA